MDEVLELKKIFSNLYNGLPWTEINLIDILDGITAEQAAKRPIPQANTIWQLVNHCICLRENVLLKLQGEVFDLEENNYLSNPVDVSEIAWQKLLDRLEKSELNWELFLNNFSNVNLNNGYLPFNNKFTQYEVIHGILHHDNYHFGQISMLKKLL